MNAIDLVRELGGDPDATEEQSLTLLGNEIIILRDRLARAQDAEGRAERRLGAEIDAHAAAERRAKVCERALAEIDYAVTDAKVSALRVGAPLRALHDDPLETLAASS